MDRHRAGDRCNHPFGIVSAFVAAGEGTAPLRSAIDQKRRWISAETPALIQRISVDVESPQSDRIGQASTIRGFDLRDLGGGGSVVFEWAGKVEGVLGGTQRSDSE